jgi:T4 RnlA family RNA ligase
MFETKTDINYIPSYEDCLEMCQRPDSPFYESKFILDGFNVSIFNYRLAQWSDFSNPLPNKPLVKGYEMRGLTFVFNKDGTVYKRFLLLEKFFNLNQTPDSMYSIVKNYKIKFVNEKEDGSIASFIELPNGTIYGKSKMSFESEQAIGVTDLFKRNQDVNSFVSWTMKNDIVAIFEYVAPHNRIVVRYPKEELILLRLRDNKTGKHLDIKDYYDKLGSIKIAPFIDDFKDLDNLVELTGKLVDKEGYVIQAEDSNGRDFFFKLKSPWYVERHGLLTEDLYKENVIIGYILDDKIDDILGQVPEDEVEARQRIQKLISVIIREIDKKSTEIDKLYNVYLNMNSNKREFAIKYSKDPNFRFISEMIKADEMKKMSPDEILLKYGNIEKFKESLSKKDKYELIKEWIRDLTKRLFMARDWLLKRDPSLFFKDPVENEDAN